MKQELLKTYGPNRARLYAKWNYYDKKSFVQAHWNKRFSQLCFKAMRK